METARWGQENHSESVAHGIEGEIKAVSVGQSRSPGRAPLLSPIFSTEEPAA